MGLNGSQGPTGDSQGAVSLPQSDSSMWREVLDALESNTQPSLQTLRQLRAALFHESQDSEQSLMIAKYLGEIVNGKIVQDESRAWDLLQVWMDELDIGVEEIGRRAKPEELTQSRDVSEEINTFESKSAPKTKPEDDASALARSAVRFTDGVATISETEIVEAPEALEENDVNKAHQMALLEDEFLAIRKQINIRIGKWEDRYGARSDRYKNNVTQKLQKLIEELRPALNASDLSHVEDVVDAARILWNKAIKIERDLFHETKGGSSYKVDLHEYTDYEPSDAKNASGREAVDPVGRSKKKKVGFKGHRGEVIEALKL